MPLPPPFEDAETLAKRRRIIDQEETAALRRFSLMKKEPKMTQKEKRLAKKEKKK